MNKTSTKWMFFVLHIYWIALLIVPFRYERALFRDPDAAWQTIYLLDDASMLRLIMPSYILWLVCCFIQHNFLKNIFRWFLFFLALLYAFIFGLSSLMAAQDYAPSWGYLLMVLMLPLLMIWAGIDVLTETASKRYIASTNILDDFNNLEK